VVYPLPRSYELLLVRGLHLPVRAARQDGSDKSVRWGLNGPALIPMPVAAEVMKEELAGVR
jgi:hypothetical protein